MIGSDEPSPSIRRSISSGSGNGPLSTMPASDGNVPEVLASRVASSTSVRSAGITTIALSVSRGRTLTIDIPATTTPSASRSQQVGVALDEPALDGAHDAAHRRRDEEAGPRGAPRPAPCGRRRPSRGDAAMRLDRCDDSASWSGSARLATTASSAARPCASSASASEAICPSRRACAAIVEPSCSGCPCAARPPSTRSTGAPRLAAMRAL